MRVLLLHPEDAPDGAAWTREHWDLVIDLGFAGLETYEGWSRTLHAAVRSIYEFVEKSEGHVWVNQLIQRGRDRLVDRLGLDWWEILANESSQDLSMLYLFRQLQREIRGGGLELAASRPHRSARIAEHVFGASVRFVWAERSGVIPRTLRALQSAWKLRAAQIAEIAFDKWDSGYQLRRRLAQRDRANIAEPCLLLPTAYSNVTRSVLAYASQLPHRRFLLIATRQNAIPSRTGKNVAVSSIAAYTPNQESTRAERGALQQAWQEFVRRLRTEDADFRCAADTGVWDYFPAYLGHGLLLRDAWAEVLRSEQVTGVLCGDDLNYSTRLPLILAQKEGLNAVYCSHGALDSGFFFKKPYADSFLVKGEMEQDYLMRAAIVDRERIFVGAPACTQQIPADSRSADAIVFFSQPYEVTGARADAVYRQIVPRLQSVARACKKKLIIKLHPFESVRARRALVKSALNHSECESVEIVAGVPPEQVMSRAWCGLTVDSSVAVECAVNDIPFFLCGWLDFTGDGYLEQFARFGVANVLPSPDHIELIPRMVSDFRPDPARRERIWREADPRQLDAIMFGTRRARLKQCVC